MAGLKSQFLMESAPGPVRAAHYLFGEVIPGESEDIRLRHLQGQLDAVSLASAFRVAASQDPLLRSPIGTNSCMP